MSKKPFSLQWQILERAYDQRTLEDILEKYQAARLTDGIGYYKPTKAHILLYVEWIKGRLELKAAAKEMGIKSAGSVMNRFGRITQMIFNGDLPMPTELSKKK